MREIIYLSGCSTCTTYLTHSYVSSEITRPLAFRIETYDPIQSDTSLSSSDNDSSQVCDNFVGRITQQVTYTLSNMRYFRSPM